MSAGKIDLEHASLETVDGIVGVHMRAFRGSFLTNLGRNVLKVFYTSLLKDDSVIFRVASINEEIVGFYAASTSTRGLYKKIFLLNFSKFFAPLMIRFTNNPFLFFRLLKSYSSGRVIVVPGDTNCSLLSICVDTDFSGKGVGGLLLLDLESCLKKLSISRYYLTTDAENNFEANSFYKKRGFVIVGNHYQGLRKMNILLRSFNCD